MEVNIKTKQDLQTAVINGCKQFSQETVRKIINQFPYRCHKIVESKGGNYRFKETECREYL